MKLEKLQEMHAKLRKAKYFYYERHQSIISDYDFDILEKEYNTLAEEIGVDKELQVSEFVGFSLNIPMNLNNYYKEVFSVLIFKFSSVVSTNL